MVKLEIREEIRTHYLLYVDDEGPFGVLEYARNILANWSNIGYAEEILILYQKYSAKRLSDVPVESYAEFVEDVLNFNPIKN